MASPQFLSVTEKCLQVASDLTPPFGIQLQHPDAKLAQRRPSSETHAGRQRWAEPSLLGGTHLAIFAAEVMDHHAVGIPGERTARDTERLRSRLAVGSAQYD